MTDPAPATTQQRYLEIAAHLRNQILAGELVAGDEIPSEAQLCRSFGVARGTVRQAVAVLRREGMISSGQGRRSRVVDTVPTQSFDNVFSFTQWCLDAGIQPGQKTQWVTRKPADAHTATLLGLPDESTIVSVLRLRLMDGTPAMVERLNYPLVFGQHVLTFDTDSGSIYQRLTEAGMVVDKATRTIDAVPADETDAELLEVPVGTPLLRVRRRAFTPEGDAIEASDDRYLFNKATFTINFSRDTPNPLAISPAESFPNRDA